MIIASMKLRAMYPWERSLDGRLFTTDIHERFSKVGNEQTPIAGVLLASATTIAPTHGIHQVSGTTEVVNITVPYVGFSGTIILLPTGAFTWTAAGNIAVLGTAVVAKALHLTYLPGTGKWYPSYVA